MAIHDPPELARLVVGESPDAGKESGHGSGSFSVDIRLASNAERRQPIFEQPRTMLKASIASEQLQLLLNRLLDRVGLLLGQSTDT
jgi:hypothetical protein